VENAYKVQYAIMVKIKMILQNVSEFVMKISFILMELVDSEAVQIAIKIMDLVDA
jgi:hypothetical protein